MSLLLIIVHLIVCIALIMIVLLQTGKGADMGAAFGGGGSQTLFGSTGASTFLSKATTVAAIVFMLTSLTLAYVSSHKAPDSIMENVKTPVEQKEIIPPVDKKTKESAKPAESNKNVSETKTDKSEATTESQSNETSSQEAPSKTE